MEFGKKYFCNLKILLIWNLNRNFIIEVKFEKIIKIELEKIISKNNNVEFCENQTRFYRVKKDLYWYSKNLNCIHYILFRKIVEENQRGILWYIYYIVSTTKFFWRRCRSNWLIMITTHSQK